MSTYTQIHIHIVFRVKNLNHQLGSEIRTNVFKYIFGIISNLGHKPLIVNGMSDHVHLLVGLKPDKCISDLVKEVKRSSTNFINQKRFTNGKFAWQEGYGAFCHTSSTLPRVIKYIKNQEKHHSQWTYKEEYIKILKKNNVIYDPDRLI